MQNRTRQGLENRVRNGRGRGRNGGRGRRRNGHDPDIGIIPGAPVVINNRNPLNAALPVGEEEAGFSQESNNDREGDQADEEIVDIDQNRLERLNRANQRRRARGQLQRNIARQHTIDEFNQNEHQFEEVNENIGIYVTKIKQLCSALCRINERILLIHLCIFIMHMAEFLNYNKRLFTLYLKAGVSCLT